MSIDYPGVFGVLALLFLLVSLVGLGATSSHSHSTELPRGQNAQATSAYHTQDSPSAGTESVTGDCTPHPPIRIVGDAMFNLGPAVGVTNPTAAGTADDPYLIQGWCITPPYPTPRVGAGIALRNTTAHVIIQDNRIDGLGDQDHGVQVTGVRNTTLAHNTVEGNDDAGIAVRESHGTTLRNNTLTANGGDFNADAIALTHADNTTIVNNTVASNPTTGFSIDWSDGVRITDNRITTNDGAGLDFYDSDRAHITNNTIAGNGFYGIAMAQSSNVSIANNTLASNDRGILVYFSSDARIVYNNITNQLEVGVEISPDSGDALLAYNNIHDNAGAGLEAPGNSEPVDARHNWWGASNGPSGGVEDACNGTVADGDGDEIVTIHGGTACFDPWRSSPNPDGGVS